MTLDELAEEVVRSLPLGQSLCDDAARSALIKGALRQAVLAEREACAALAQAHLIRTPHGYTVTPTQREIAAAIRGRAEP